VSIAALARHWRALQRWHSAGCCREISPDCTAATLLENVFVFRDASVAATVVGLLYVHF